MGTSQEIPEGKESEKLAYEPAEHRRKSGVTGRTVKVGRGNFHYLCDGVDILKESALAGKRRIWLRALLVMVALGAGCGLWSSAWVMIYPGDTLRTLQKWSIDAALGSPEFVETPVGSLAVWRGGPPSITTTVFVHGFGDAGAGWTQVATALAHDRSVVVLDLPGHGRSAPQTGPLSFELLLTGLDSLLESIEGPIVLVGNSLGGWLAATWSLEHPERIQRLVLVNNAGFRTPLAVGELLPDTREGMRRKNEAVLGANAPSLPGFLLDGLLEIHADPRLHALFEHLMTQAPHLDEGPIHYSGAVQLVWGTPDPFFPEEGYLPRVQAAFPQATTERLDGCAHAPQYSCPDQLAAVLAKTSEGAAATE